MRYKGSSKLPLGMRAMPLWLWLKSKREPESLLLSNTDFDLSVPPQVRQEDQSKGVEELSAQSASHCVKGEPIKIKKMLRFLLVSLTNLKRAP